MLVRCCCILILSSLLTTSSFSLQQYLIQQLLANTYSQSQLRYAVNIPITRAQKIQLSNLPKGSTSWLKLATKVGRTDPKIAWQLAQYYQQREQIRDHAYWLNSAVKLGNIDAIINQATKLAISESQHIKAKDLLQRINLAGVFSTSADVTLNASTDDFIASYSQALQLSIRLAIKFADNAWLREILPLLTHKQLADDNEIDVLQQQLQRFNIVDNDTLKTRMSSPHAEFAEHIFPGIQGSQQCEYPLQFFASELEHLVILESKLANIMQQPFFANSFCYLPIQFISNKQLVCDHQTEQRINCAINVAPFTGNTDVVESPTLAQLPTAMLSTPMLSTSVLAKPARGFVGFMTRKGNANVNNGVLFIDEEDTEQVIEHELLHLLGYIDEYPLPQGHSACLQEETTAIAKNIIVDNESIFVSDKAAKLALKNTVPWFELINKDTPITHQTAQGFMLGTPTQYQHEVGLFMANTCQHQKQNAFKPIFKPTKLEYFEEPLPAIYQSPQLEKFEHFSMPLTVL